MTAPLDQLPLPFPLFPSSSNIDSKSRTVHSSDCSIRPQKNIIKIKEEWWGSTGNHSTLLSMEDEREMDKRRTRKRLQYTDVQGSQREVQSSYERMREKRARVASVSFDEVNHTSSLSQITLRRDRSSLFTSYQPLESIPPSRPTSFKKQKRSTRAVESHPWPSSRPALPPRRRSPAPTPIPLRSANFILGTPIAVLQEEHQHVFSDYEPFLTNQPIESIFSLSFYRNQIEFFTLVSPPSNWSTRVGSKIFKPPSWPILSEKVMNLEPNFEFIRQRFPLKRSNTTSTGPQTNHTDWEGAHRVLKWIYGKELRFDEQLWFLENAPLPLLALLKIHLSNRGYARGIWSVATQFETYLDRTPSSHLSSFELRAREPLAWLRIDSSKGQRSERWRNWWIDEVQRERDGKTMKGNYWLEGIEGLRTIRDLERWEDDLKRTKRWRYRQTAW